MRAKPKFTAGDWVYVVDDPVHSTQFNYNSTDRRKVLQKAGKRLLVQLDGQLRSPRLDWSSQDICYFASGVYFVEGDLLSCDEARIRRKALKLANVSSLL